EVKRRSADGSVGPPHARVGNCQASNKEPLSTAEGFLLSGVATKPQGFGYYRIRIFTRDST
ncbi:hypothetical protein ROM10_15110, partial [Cronobacter sakazakii]|uniref:hypothetical protein n=1 Tax=Cronobacter sakazakii TaxID=28141 RepID=UPI002893A998